MSRSLQRPLPILGFTLLITLATLCAPRPVLGDLGIRTVLVSPVPGDPIASGQALHDALKGIPDPSTTNRWMIKIEPGIYDLIHSPFVMREWVDIEGSGSTRIVGRGRNELEDGVIVGANNSELRDLTVFVNGANAGGFPYAVAIYLPGVNTKISRVRAVAKNGSSTSEAIFVYGGSPTLRQIEAVAEGGQFANGIGFQSSPTATLDNTTIEASGATDTTRGIVLVNLQDGVPALADVRIAVTGGPRSYGVHYFTSGGYGPLLELRDSVIEVSGGTVESVGILTLGGPLRVQASRVVASGTASVGVRAFTGGVRTEVQGSIVGGDLHSVEGWVAVGLSQLMGGPAEAIFGCAGSHDENYVFYANTCP